MHPNINYSHVVQELAVNASEQLEIIRELISNSYDADATRMRLVVLPECNGLIFLDDGVGMPRQGAAGKPSPWEAFFSVGYEIKTKHVGFGYKGQGAKLAFNSDKVLVLTKCRGADDAWVGCQINPEDLTTQTDISPQVMDPAASLDTFFGRGTSMTQQAVDAIKRSFDGAGADAFHHGTLIAIKWYGGRETGPFYADFSTDGDAFLAAYRPETSEREVKRGKHEFTKLWNYIRLRTAHGNVLKITTAQGFKDGDCSDLNPLVREARLELWLHDMGDQAGGGFIEVPYGFDYLPCKSVDALPETINDLGDGRFSARAAGQFKIETMRFQWVLAVDGGRWASSGWDNLGRSGAPRSTLSLRSEVRGLQLAVGGVKICQFNQLFSQATRSDELTVLADPAAARHYLLVINGPFDLVTDRNDLTQSSKKMLTSDTFREKLREIFKNLSKDAGTAIRVTRIDAAGEKTARIDHGAIVKQLVNRLNKNIIAVDYEQRQSKITASKEALELRTRFTFNQGALKGRTFYAPMLDEEGGVGLMYSILSYHAAKNQELWWYPLTMAGRSVDAIGLDRAGKTVAIEYKNRFDYRDWFNHPLTHVDLIVAWEFCPVPEVGQEVRDKRYVGRIVALDNHPMETAFGICDLQDSIGAPFGAQGEVKTIVVSLKSLISSTFGDMGEWRNLQPAPEAGKPRGRKARSPALV